MTNKNQKKQDDKNTTGSIVAELAGTAAIAGIKIAMALRDKKTREKIKKTLVNVKDQAIDYVETLKTNPIKIEIKKNIS